jgi:hypothetical protein
VGPTDEQGADRYMLCDGQHCERKILSRTPEKSESLAFVVKAIVLEWHGFRSRYLPRCDVSAPKFPVTAGTGCLFLV